jgi:four helix bundle protein
MHDFRRLLVWQRARAVASDVDAAVRRFPRHDRGVIGAQLRRSAFSIAASIAEGCGKSSRRETVRYLQIASGSASETENHLIAASDTDCIHPVHATRLLDEVKTIQRMLYRLMQALPQDAPPSGAS